MTVRTPFASIRSRSLEKPGRVSIGSAPETAGSLNQSTIAKPADLANRSIAARCRFSESLSAPTLVADDVRTYPKAFSRFRLRAIGLSPCVLYSSRKTVHRRLNDPQVTSEL